MPKELWSVLREAARKIFQSRLFPVGLFFILLFGILVGRLYTLQILEQEQHQEAYIQKTLTTIATPAVRGNIYDRNGVLLAGNKLVYSVTLKDTGAYIKSNDKNNMILKLIHLLDECEEEIDLPLPLELSKTGPEVYAYSTASPTRIRQFLRDIYGLSSVSELDKNGRYPSDITADEAVEVLKKNYYFSKWVGEDKQPVVTDPWDVLRVLNIRYALAQNRYRKYLSVTLVKNVKERTVSTILEHANEIIGVDVEEDYQRYYPEGTYFSQIIGYTGKASTEELEKLLEEDDTYLYGDIIGKSGVEQLMELELSGTKGEKTMYLDSTGKVLEVLSEVESRRGNSVYLTIDHDLEIAAYNLLEEMLAGILVSKIVNEDIEENSQESDEVQIPVKKVYYQFLANHILSIKHFTEDGASTAEQEIGRIYQKRNDQVYAELLAEFDAPKHTLSDLSEKLAKYETWLVKNFLQTGLTTASYAQSSAVKSFYAGELGLIALIQDMIMNNVISVEQLSVSETYLDSEQIFDAVKSELLRAVKEEEGFSLLLYKELIDEEVLSGNLLCMALFDQGVLTDTQNIRNRLPGASKEEVCEMVRNLIFTRKLTPGQLALDPCNGAITVTDVNSGDVLACVSYPGYDNNYFSGTVNSTYFSSLLNNAANPLYNYATQALSAPGSTFKMLSSIVGLEEGVIDTTTEVDCIGLFDKVSPPARCWVMAHGRDGHGALNVFGALANSCNYYYYELGYRLSLDEEGVYTPALGMEKFIHYCELLGLNKKSGIEMNESAPKVATEFPVVTAIGQSNNSYSNVQLAHYVQTLANGGILFDLSLLDQVKDPDGRVVKDYQREGVPVKEISEETFSVIQKGMFEVTETGTVSDYFRQMTVNIAGKTGTAQEDLHRPSHAHYVSFGPVEKPEISITSTIRFGYTSGNTAILTRELYRYYFGEISLEDILQQNAITVDGVAVSD